jgi:hypothetical protein
MESRNPFSKGFKKLKRKFAEGGRQRDGRSGIETAQEGREANTESEASQRNSRLHPEVEDVESGPSRGGNDVGGEEVGQIDPPTSTSSIPHSGEPNSMWIALFHCLLPLIVSSGNVDSPAAPGHVQEALCSDQNEPGQEANPVDPSPAPSVPSISHGGEPGSTTLPTLPQPPPVTVSLSDADSPPILDHVWEPSKSSTHLLDPGVTSEDTPNRNPASSTAIISILRGVGESSEAYPPLKSVARSLCVILDNCEVRSSFCTFNP